MRVPVVGVLLGSALASLATAQSLFTGPNQTCLKYNVVSVEAEGTFVAGYLAVTLLDVIGGVNITHQLYTPGQDLTVSIGPGIDRLIAFLKSYSAACPATQYILAGSGQGASFISATLAGTDLGDYFFTPLPSDIGSKIVAVVLFQDPTQNPSIGTQGACPSVCTTSGPLAVTGQFVDTLNVYASRIQNWCSANDNNCCGGAGTTSVKVGSYMAEKNRNSAVWFVGQHVGFTNLSSFQLKPSDLPSCPATTSVVVAPQTTSTASATTVAPPPPATTATTSSQAPAPPTQPITTTTVPASSTVAPAPLPTSTAVPSAQPSATSGDQPCTTTPQAPPPPPPTASQLQPVSPPSSHVSSALRPYRSLISAKSVPGYSPTASGSIAVSMPASAIVPPSPTSTGGSGSSSGGAAATTSPAPSRGEGNSLSIGGTSAAAMGFAVIFGSMLAGALM